MIKVCSFCFAKKNPAKSLLPAGGQAKTVDSPRGGTARNSISVFPLVIAYNSSPGKFHIASKMQFGFF